MAAGYHDTVIGSVSHRKESDRQMAQCECRAGFHGGVECFNEARWEVTRYTPENEPMQVKVCRFCVIMGDNNRREIA
jgi:hypothetical protein